MNQKSLSKPEIDLLRKYHTPSVCNVAKLDSVRPNNTGYMDRHIQACFPDVPLMAGYATTATSQAAAPEKDFLTNNFSLPALTIAKLYRCRWKVELFFKWIKQHLRIKAFYGTTENAVKTQIWIAVTVYVLVAILKKRLNLDPSLHTILQILSVHPFEKTPLLQALSQVDYTIPEGEDCIQLKLFDL